MSRPVPCVVLLVLAACSGGEETPASADAVPGGTGSSAASASSSASSSGDAESSTSASGQDASTSAASTLSTSSSGAASASSSAAAASATSSSSGSPAAMEIRFLGVQGFLLQHGDDALLTAPLFTRASIPAVTLGQVTPDEAAIRAGLATIPLGNVRGIISGHAHYDHLMDVPSTMLAIPGSTLYANRTARHLLAAWAPDRAESCGPAPAQPISRSRVIAVDDAVNSLVDYRMCPEQRPEGAPLEGTWSHVPNSRIRVMPLCATHPDQFLVFHFGSGDLEEDACELPSSAADWVEGTTVAFLIDFLDDDGAPRFRVYYQDAPTTAPVGHVPPELLAQKGVDVALLCVGSYEQVQDQPGEVIAALTPRFALSGHWEDFFLDASWPARPLPFMSLEEYLERAEAAVTGTADPPLVVDGAASGSRHVLAMPGSTFMVPPEP